MICLRHEPGFDGLLSAIAWGLRRQVVPDALFSTADPPTLLSCQLVKTEPGIRQTFLDYLQPILGQTVTAAVMDTVWKAWLSEQAGLSRAIDSFIRLAVRLRQDPSDRRQDPAVLEVVSAARKVEAQAHQYLGLLRFRSLGPELYVADLAPDYLVLPLIAPHFADRFADQAFVIRDCRRSLALLHLARGPCRLVRLLPDDPGGSPSPIDSRLGADPTDRRPSAGLPDPRGSPADRLPVPAGNGSDEPAGEADFTAMWQLYLQRLSIPERENRPLQQANMPRKYWPYLVENPDRPKFQP